jgi:hypothetical protein
LRSAKSFLCLFKCSHVFAIVYGVWGFLPEHARVAGLTGKDVDVVRFGLRGYHMYMYVYFGGVVSISLCICITSRTLMKIHPVYLSVLTCRFLIMHARVHVSAYNSHHIT